MIETAIMKPTLATNISYQIDDVEKMSFKDDSFDTIVDTFGLEYYVNPDKALEEMKRVCKKDGQILILTSGKSFYELLNRYLDIKTAYTVCNFGYFPNRDWDKYIKEEDFEIIKKERQMNGTVYMYVLKNKK